MGKIMRQFIRVAVCVLGVMLAGIASAKPSWHQWVGSLKHEAVDQGISPQLFDRIFDDIRKPNRRVLRYDRSQPEKRLTFNKYRRTRVSKYRISLGRKKYKKYHAMLEKIGKEYGVDPCFIVSFWGMESSYGNFMGKFPVIKSLATLAYDSRRAPFFRKQLLYALHIVNDGHVNLYDFKGEWAGASGQPQFLPSSWYNYAVDYDRDGRKDIWKTKSDVFASIANYVHKKGWKTGEPWAIKVKLPRNFDMSQEGRKIRKPVSEWSAMGVKTKAGKALPYQHLEASIVKPYGGPAFLAFKNFRVIMRYNNSTYYAGAIGYLADQICRRKN